MNARSTTPPAKLTRVLPYGVIAVLVACATYSSEGDPSGDAGSSTSSSSSTSSTSSSSSSTSSGNTSSGDAAIDVKCTSASACDDKNACTTDTCGANGFCEHTPVELDDAVACTKDSCEPTTGVTHAAITACQPQSDGCCPGGCTTANDPDCLSCTNLALTATPDSDSPARGSFDYAPVNLNDGLINANCTKYCWVETAQGPTASFTYTWPNAVKVASMVIVSNPQGSCPGDSHVLSGGTVETWDGTAWKQAMLFSNKSGKYTLDLPAPVLTTKVRITNTQVIGFNPQMYEWAIYNKTGCTLP